MARTQRDNIIAALIARGYVQRKSQGRYLAYGFPGKTRYLLLGSAGAVRSTTGSIANSIPIADAKKAMLLKEGEAIYYTGRARKHSQAEAVR